MATNITVYDLDNYPDNAKTITTDQTTVVPTGAYGDEKWVLSFTTSAYSDNTNLTAIQDIYVQDLKAGWIKSSGLVSGPYVVGVSNDSLGVKIDNSSKYYYIDVTNGSYGGDSLASELQTKIRAVPTTSGIGWSSSDDSLAYKNSVVEYNDGKFRIVSGSVGAFYTGSSRSSVQVLASVGDTLYDDLGFNLGVDSETLAGVVVKEATVASTYTGGTSPMSISADIGATAGDAVMITNGTNTEYFTVLSGTVTSLEVAIINPHTFDAIANTYSGGGVSKVQLLRAQDPEGKPTSFRSTVDSAVRWGILSIINQIDFSS
ncbi:hypothetical protein LCGC14_0717090 [marine sediment metagenome]|uniref:Uncharacterized protein n=1 Tax=marine sediment metagenome TaxID=412755 RepID=A0A0F9SZ14_9ZZZZ|nr:hypothetical protein [bacterium]